MISRILTIRPAMLFAALVAVAAMFAADARTATAQCCNVNIRNSTDCRFEACLNFGDTRRCVVIHPGGNNFDVPECPDYRFTVTDVCGTTHAFPMIPGTSINVLTSRGCCLRIYLASDCCWEVTPAADCSPCNG